MLSAPPDRAMAREGRCSNGAKASICLSKMWAGKGEVVIGATIAGECISQPFANGLCQAGNQWLFTANALFFLYGAGGDAFRNGDEFCRELIQHYARFLVAFQRIE